MAPRTSLRLLRLRLRPPLLRLSLAAALLLSLFGALLPAPPLQASQSTDPPSPHKSSDATPHQPANISRLFLPLVGMPVAPATSFDLIERALAAGTINAETALVYKVFATFADPRLPAQFRGLVSKTPETHIIGQVQDQYSGLSANARAILTPFLIPPAYEGSWANPASPAASRSQGSDLPAGLSHDWQTITAQHVPVKVWWHAVAHPEDQARAQSVADAMDSLIWSKLTGLMGKQPLADSAATTNGGDGRLDIYLVGMGSGNDGETIGYTGKCVADAAYILLNRTLSAKVLLASAAHEFMHAIQDAFSTQYCSDYTWLMEATATWAEDYVYGTPNYQTEHEYLSDFLDVPETSLEDRAGLHEYGAYLLPFFVTHRGTPDRIRRMWELSEQYADSLQAVNASLPSAKGFQETWPQFALDNWNDGPAKEYETWDQIKAHAKFTRDSRVTLNGAPQQEFTLATDINHLAARYFHFAFTDDSVRTVDVYNPFYASRDPDAHMQLVYKIEGRQDWETPLDITDKPGKSFCRDAKAERLSEMLVVISNSAWKDRSHQLKPAKPPKLVATNVGCWKWTGTVSVIGDFHYGTRHMSESTDVTNLVFERLGQGLGWITFLSSQGNATWHHTGGNESCSGQGSGAYPIRKNGSLLLYPQYDDDVGNVHRYRQINGLGFIASQDIYTIAYHCMDNTSYQVVGINIDWFSTNPDPGHKGYLTFGQDGATLDGSNTMRQVDPAGETYTWTYHWHFTAQRE